jgi:hypothetical protein
LEETAKATPADTQDHEARIQLLEAKLNAYISCNENLIDLVRRLGYDVEWLGERYDEMHSDDDDEE